MKHLIGLSLVGFALAGCDFDPEAMAGGGSENSYRSYESTSSYYCRVPMEKTQATGTDCNFAPDLNYLVFIEPSDGRSVRLTFSDFMRLGVPKLSSLIYKLEGYGSYTVSADCKLESNTTSANTYSCRLPYFPGGPGEKARVVSVNVETDHCRIQYERRIPNSYNEEDCNAEYADTYLGTFSDVQFPRLEGN